MGGNNVREFKNSAFVLLKMRLFISLTCVSRSSEARALPHCRSEKNALMQGSGHIQSHFYHHHLSSCLFIAWFVKCLWNAVCCWWYCFKLSQLWVFATHPQDLVTRDNTQQSFVVCFANRTFDAVMLIYILTLKKFFSFLLVSSSGSFYCICSPWSLSSWYCQTCCVKGTQQWKTPPAGPDRMSRKGKVSSDTATSSSDMYAATQKLIYLFPNVNTILHRMGLQKISYRYWCTHFTSPFHSK